MAHTGQPPAVAAAAAIAVGGAGAGATAEATRPLPTIGSRLASRENNFDFIRLVAAFAVILSHSWPIRDGSLEHEPYRRLSGYCNLGEVSIAIFFVISGMLVARSYLSDPNPWRYLAKRSLRIFPGLIVCVAVCVLVVGPLFTELPLREYFTSRWTLKFSRNAILVPNYFGLPGVFSQFAQSDPRSAVNGSLWSLPVEFLMYLGVLALGVVGLLRRRWCVILVASGLLLHWMFIERAVFAPDGWEQVHPRAAAFIEKYRVWLENLPQLGFLFFSGTLMLLYKDRVVLDWRLFLASLLLIAAGWKTPHGYFMFCLGLPYVVMYLAFARAGKLAPILQSVTKRGDFSYGVYLYGYPVQQMLMRRFGEHLPFPVFIGLACCGTLVLAFLSWHLVERPFLTLKKRPTHVPPATGLDAVVSGVAPGPAQDVANGTTAATRPIRSSATRAASLL